MLEEKEVTLPTLSELEIEYSRVTHRIAFSSVLRSTLYILITVAAIAVLISVFCMPVLRI